jgi:hypothetical protein
MNEKIEFEYVVTSQVIWFTPEEFAHLNGKLVKLTVEILGDWNEPLRA